MLGDYVAAGLDPEVFWTLTPRLYMVHMEGAAKRIERHGKDLAWLAWMGAALQRTSKMPRLDKFLKPSKTKGRISAGWQAQAAMWAAYAKRKEGAR